MASGSCKPPSYQMVAVNHSKSGTVLLLKDYLRDDLSSCSSSGFRSLPRRQCCLQPRSSSCSAKSALHKASEALLNAIKSVALPSRKRSPPLPQTQRCKAKKGGVLSRSLSRRLLSRSFWRRASSKEVKNTTFRSTANSNSWSQSHSTSSLTDGAELEGSVTTTNTCSVTNSTRAYGFPKEYDNQVSAQPLILAFFKEIKDCKFTGMEQDWPNEEKEQFSPVSVLDCPLFDDDEEITTSPFNSTSCSRLEGGKHKHMQRSRHFNRVASLNPVALEKKISRSELEEDEAIYKPCPVLVSIMSTQNGNSKLFGDNVEENARDLLTLFKKSIPSVCLRIEAENLLFDFFKQSIWENNGIENLMKGKLCEVAENWIRGHPQEQYLSLQHVRNVREIYIKEMDKCSGGWGNSDEQVQRLAMELEVEFSTSLVNELVLDLTTCVTSRSSSCM